MEVRIKVSKNEGEFQRRVKLFWMIGFDDHERECLKWIDEAHKEFKELLEGDPLDWIHHSGEKMEAYQKLVLKWFGDSR